MHTQNSQDKLWLYICLSIPLCSIFFGSITLYVATSGKDSLVAEDYYKKGLGLNQAKERVNYAKHLGLTAEITLLGSEIIISGTIANNLPNKNIVIAFRHPTLNTRDFQLQLEKVEDYFKAPLPEALSGKWYVVLSDATNKWELPGILYADSKAPLRLPSQ